MAIPKIPPRRTDVWTDEEDSLLKDTVLEYIRTGRSQVAAFESVANELGRTSAACGFRWNGVLRRNFECEVFEAKQDRLRRRSAARQPVPNESPQGNTSMTSTRSPSSQGMDEVIGFLKNLEHAYESLRHERNELERTCEQLQQRVHALQASLAGKPTPQTVDLTPDQIERDAMMLANIMSRARRLVDHA